MVAAHPAVAPSSLGLRGVTRSKAGLHLSLVWDGGHVAAGVIVIGGCGDTTGCRGCSRPLGEWQLVNPEGVSPSIVGSVLDVLHALHALHALHGTSGNRREGILDKACVCSA